MSWLNKSRHQIINEYKSLNPTKPVIERDAQSDRIVEILKRVN